MPAPRAPAGRAILGGTAPALGRRCGRVCRPVCADAAPAVHQFCLDKPLGARGRRRIRQDDGAILSELTDIQLSVHSEEAYDPSRLHARWVLELCAEWGSTFYVTPTDFSENDARDTAERLLAANQHPAASPDEGLSVCGYHAGLHPARGTQSLGGVRRAELRV